MWAELSHQYAMTCRYDYVKFSFPDGGPEWTNHIEDEIKNAHALNQQERYPHQLIIPRKTYLQPNSSRPMGRVIWELFGLAAMAVRDLPASWMQYLTYAHVKSYGAYDDVGQITLLQVKLLTSRGPRNIALNVQGDRSRTQKGMAMPSIRLGSRKSDWHGIVYCREGENMGFEGRYTDDRLAGHCITALDVREHTTMTEPRCWDYLLRVMGRETAQLWHEELEARGIDLAAYVGSFDGLDRFREGSAPPILPPDEKPPELPAPADGERGPHFPR